MVVIMDINRNVSTKRLVNMGTGSPSPPTVINLSPFLHYSCSSYFHVKDCITTSLFRTNYCQYIVKFALSVSLSQLRSSLVVSIDKQQVIHSISRLTVTAVLLRICSKISPKPW